MRAPYIKLAALALAASAAPAAPLAAQGAGDGFLFGQPDIVFELHGGFARPDAASDVFSLATEQLILDSGDFTGFAAGGSISVPLNPRIELGVTGGYLGRIRKAEFRDWVDQDELPIEQRLEFSRVPLLVTARLNLLPSGRTIGSFAWLPSPITPYVRVGGGALWYRYRQVGDFVDYVDLSIFYDELDSEGWAPAAQAAAGFDITLSPRLAIRTEGGYLWSDAELGSDFIDFDPIDLSGYSATVGLSLRL